MKRYGKTVALAGLDAEIGPGITGLLGSNGAGKTTFISVILGLRSWDAGELTVLAPTDAAFKRVPKSTLRAVQRNPKLLKRVLLYHVISGKAPSSTVVTLKSAKTLAGPPVKIRVTGNRVFVNNARVTKVDIAASNGIIHVINRVLIPPKS